MKFTTTLYLLFILICVTGCIRDDAEPTPGETNISRLYISTSEFQPNTGAVAFNNIFLISPADTNNFEQNRSQAFTSEAKGGSIIHYNPISSMLYQGSQNNLGLSDTVVYGMEAGRTGTLSNRSRIRNKLFQNVKGLAYDQRNDNLYVYENLQRSIYVINNPKGRSNFTVPNAGVKVTGDISGWALAMRGTDLFLTTTGANGGIAVLPGAVTNEPFKNVTDIKILPLQGSANIRGMAYDTVKNVLALTDYAISGGTSTGKIYIFENVADLKSLTSLTPTRTITGAATLLQEPIDVAIDTRESGKYLYVADQKAKKVFRFRIDAQGNEAPDAVHTPANGYTPVSIALDARTIQN